VTTFHALRIAGLLLLFLLAPSALAQDDELSERRQQAQQLADKAFDLLQQGSYDEAAELFRKADKRFHSPVFLVFAAEAEEKRGRLLAAHELLKAIDEEDLADYAPDAFRTAKQQARERLDALTPRIPRLQVTVRGGAEGASFSLDDRELARAELDAPILVDPGDHVLTVRRADGPMIERRFSVAAGEESQLEIDLGGDAVEEPAEEDSARYWAPGIVFGFGAGWLVVGISVGIAFVGQADDLDARCEAYGAPLGDPNKCPPEAEADADDVKVLGNVATASFVIAGASAVAGTLLLLLWPSDEEGASSAAVRVGPSRVAFEMRF
jgi:tetratricopeptide (TPR) repeat protein